MTRNRIISALVWVLFLVIDGPALSADPESSSGSTGGSSGSEQASDSQTKPTPTPSPGAGDEISKKLAQEIKELKASNDLKAIEYRVQLEQEANPSKEGDNSPADTAHAKTADGKSGNKTANGQSNELLSELLKRRDQLRFTQMTEGDNPFSKDKLQNSLTQSGFENLKKIVEKGNAEKWSANKTGIAINKALGFPEGQGPRNTQNVVEAFFPSKVEVKEEEKQRKVEVPQETKVYNPPATEKKGPEEKKQAELNSPAQTKKMQQKMLDSIESVQQDLLEHVQNGLVLQALKAGKDPLTDSELRSKLGLKGSDNDFVQSHWEELKKHVLRNGEHEPDSTEFKALEAENKKQLTDDINFMRGLPDGVGHGLASWRTHISSGSSEDKEFASGLNEAIGTQDWAPGLRESRLPPEMNPFINLDPLKMVAKSGKVPANIDDFLRQVNPVSLSMQLDEAALSFGQDWNAAKAKYQEYLQIIKDNQVALESASAQGFPTFGSDKNSKFDFKKAYYEATGTEAPLFLEAYYLNSNESTRLNIAQLLAVDPTALTSKEDRSRAVKGGEKFIVTDATRLHLAQLLGVDPATLTSREDQAKTAKEREQFLFNVLRERDPEVIKSAAMGHHNPSASLLGAYEAAHPSTETVIKGFATAGNVDSAKRLPLLAEWIAKRPPQVSDTPVDLARSYLGKGATSKEVEELSGQIRYLQDQGITFGSPGAKELVRITQDRQAYQQSLVENRAHYLISGATNDTAAKISADPFLKQFGTSDQVQKAMQKSARSLEINSSVLENIQQVGVGENVRAVTQLFKRELEESRGIYESEREKARLEVAKNSNTLAKLKVLENEVAFQEAAVKGQKKQLLVADIPGEQRLPSEIPIATRDRLSLFQKDLDLAKKAVSDFELQNNISKVRTDLVEKQQLIQRWDVRMAQEEQEKVAKLVTLRANEIKKRLDSTKPELAVQTKEVEKAILDYDKKVGFASVLGPSFATAGAKVELSSQPVVKYLADTAKRDLVEFGISDSSAKQLISASLKTGADHQKELTTQAQTLLENLKGAGRVTGTGYFELALDRKGLVRRVSTEEQILKPVGDKVGELEAYVGKLARVMGTPDSFQVLKGNIFNQAFSSGRPMGAVGNVGYHIYDPGAFEKGAATGRIAGVEFFKAGDLQQVAQKEWAAKMKGYADEVSKQGEGKTSPFDYKYFENNTEAQAKFMKLQHVGPGNGPTLVAAKAGLVPAMVLKEDLGKWQAKYGNLADVSAGLQLVGNDLDGALRRLQVENNYTAQLELFYNTYAMVLAAPVFFAQAPFAAGQGGSLSVGARAFNFIVGAGRGGTGAGAVMGLAAVPTDVALHLMGSRLDYVGYVESQKRAVVNGVMSGGLAGLGVNPALGAGASSFSLDIANGADAGSAIRNALQAVVVSGVGAKFSSVAGAGSSYTARLGTEVVGNMGLTAAGQVAEGILTGKNRSLDGTERKFSFTSVVRGLAENFFQDLFSGGRDAKLPSGPVQLKANRQNTSEVNQSRVLAQSGDLDNSRSLIPNPEANINNIFRYTKKVVPTTPSLESNGTRGPPDAGGPASIEPPKLPVAHAIVPIEGNPKPALKVVDPGPPNRGPPADATNSDPQQKNKHVTADIQPNPDLKKSAEENANRTPANTTAQAEPPKQNSPKLVGGAPSEPAAKPLTPFNPRTLLELKLANERQAPKPDEGNIRGVERAIEVAKITESVEGVQVIGYDIPAYRKLSKEIDGVKVEEVEHITDYDQLLKLRDGSLVQVEIKSSDGGLTQLKNQLDLAKGNKATHILYAPRYAPTPDKVVPYNGKVIPGDGVLTNYKKSIADLGMGEALRDGTLRVVTSPEEFRRTLEEMSAQASRGLHSEKPVTDIEPSTIVAKPSSDFGQQKPGDVFGRKLTPEQEEPRKTPASLDDKLPDSKKLGTILDPLPGFGGGDFAEIFRKATGRNISNEAISPTEDVKPKLEETNRPNSNPLFTDDGEQRPNYSTRILAVTPGEKLTFSDGKSYEVVEELGSGSTTMVFKVKPLNRTPGTPELLALRLPLRGGFIGVPEGHVFDRGEELGVRYRDFIDFTGEAYPTLAAAGVPIPKLESYLPGQYLAVELLSNSKEGKPAALLTLRDLILNPEKMDPSVKTEMKAAALEFARKAKDLAVIGDLRPDQLAYDPVKKQIVLVDWTQTLRRGWFDWGNPIDPLRDSLDTYFPSHSQAKQEASSLVEEMRQAVKDERRKQSWFSSLFRPREQPIKTSAEEKKVEEIDRAKPPENQLVGTPANQIKKWIELNEKLENEALARMAKDEVKPDAQQLRQELQLKLLSEVLAESKGQPLLAMRGLRLLLEHPEWKELPEIKQRLDSTTVEGKTLREMLSLIEGVESKNSPKFTKPLEFKFLCVIGEMCSRFLAGDFADYTRSKGLADIDTVFGGSMVLKDGSFQEAPLSQIARELLTPSNEGRKENNYVFVLNSSEKNYANYQQVWNQLNDPALRKDLISKLRNEGLLSDQELKRIEEGRFKLASYQPLWDLIPGKDTSPERFSVLVDYLLINETKKGNLVPLVSATEPSKPFPNSEPPKQITQQTTVPGTPSIRKSKAAQEQPIVKELSPEVPSTEKVEVVQDNSKTKVPFKTEKEAAETRWTDGAQDKPKKGKGKKQESDEEGKGRQINREGEDDSEGGRVKNADKNYAKTRKQRGGGKTDLDIVNKAADSYKDQFADKEGNLDPHAAKQFSQFREELGRAIEKQKEQVAANGLDLGREEIEDIASKLMAQRRKKEISDFNVERAQDLGGKKLSKESEKKP